MGEIEAPPVYHVLSRGRLIGTSLLEKGDEPMGIAFGRFDSLPAYEELRPIFRLYTEAMPETSSQGWVAAKLATYWQAYDTLGLALATADGRVMTARGPYITDWSSLGWTDECEIEAQILDEEFWNAWRRVWNPRR
jgi:hypothetical protein